MSEHYEARATAHAARRDERRRLSVVIARLRLATFIPGAAILVWAIADGGPWPLVVLASGLLALFAGLVVWHARVDERADWYDALHVVNLHALARIARAWDRLPPAEPPVGGQRWSLFPGTDVPPVTRHPYAVDLDLFGRASLMQWLGPAATAAGNETLQAWLLSPATPDVIESRQGGAIELAPATEWREEFAAHGRLSADVRRAELEAFLQWAEGPPAFRPSSMRLLRVSVIGLTAAIWIGLALQVAGFTEGAYWLIPVLVGMVLSFATTGPVHGEFGRAGAGQHAFARYAGLFTHAVASPEGSAHLQDIHHRLSAEGNAAPACMRSLNRIMGFAQLRSGAGILHFPIQAMTLWDFHTLFALERWHTRVGMRVRGWMQALGELDALSAFAQARIDNPGWCLPRVAEGEHLLDGRALGHPLIPEDRRVANDIAVGPPGTLVLITGSNMSGKSTLLRAIGLNTVLAQAGAPACAASLRLPPVDLETSIRVQDSLEQGLSYFMAALARLKGVVDRSHATGVSTHRRVLYLLDEILQGTNTAERAIAVRGVARHLLQAGAIGVMTTHDLGLAQEEPLASSAVLAHFSETVDAQGVMSFDYRLRPGLATSRNALRLMELIGLHLDVEAEGGLTGGTQTRG